MRKHVLYEPQDLHFRYGEFKLHKDYFYVPNVHVDSKDETNCAHTDIGAYALHTRRTGTRMDMRKVAGSSCKLPIKN